MASYKPFFTDNNNLLNRWSEIAEKIRLFPTDRVLDMACAEGWISLWCAAVGTPIGGVKVVHGFDLDPFKIREAKKFDTQQNEKMYRKKISFGVRNIVNYNFPKTGLNQYDVILCLGILHKLTEREQILILKKIFLQPARLIVIRVQDPKFKLMERITRLASIGNFSLLRFKSRYPHQGDYYIFRKVFLPV